MNNNSLKLDLQSVLEALDHLTPDELTEVKAYIEQRLTLLNAAASLPSGPQLVAEGRLQPRRKRICEG